jgi:hypothetical protein
MKKYKTLEFEENTRSNPHEDHPNRDQPKNKTQIKMIILHSILKFEITKISQ